MKRTISGFLSLAGAVMLSLTASAIVQIDIDHDTSGAVLGRWTSDYDAVMERATKEHIPVIAFWGSAGCGWCARMKRQGLVSDAFLAWIAAKPILMLYTEVPKENTGIVTPAKTFTKGTNTTGEYPFMRVYWAKKDGSVVSVCFTGRDGKMPVKDGVTGEQLAGTLEKYFGSWTGPEPDYKGGFFSVTNDTGTVRFEAIVGKTKTVNLPLYRTETGVATNRISVGSGALANVVWAQSAKTMMWTVSVPTNLVVGKSVAVNLYADDGTTIKSSTAIHGVSEPAVSLTNPKWLGESFGVGEWTMDLDAALAKAKTSGTYTLAYASGVLWCPYCKSLETNVLNTTNFTAWAKGKNVNLVLLDNPRRSSDDVKDANGVVTSVGTKADGAAPTLLRYDVGKNSSSVAASGAAYMSRKGIAVGTSTTSGTAEYVLQRNHDLLYKGGKLAAPEALRTGYPTFILVNSDGTAAAQLLDGCSTTEKTWALSLSETLARLDELLKLQNGNMTNSAPSTTKLSLAVEGRASGTLQVNAGRLCYKLSNVPSGKVTFTASGTAKPVLSVYETSSTLAKGKRLALGTNSVAVTFSSASGKYLLVDGFPDGTAAYGSNTEKSFSLSSVVTLVPTLAAGSFTTTSGTMKMSVTAGVKYKLSGFSNYGAFTSNGNGLYTAKSTATVDLSAAAGATVSYQIWQPGTVQFAVANGTALESDGSVAVSVSRTGGSSGTASVTVSVDAGSNGSKRVSATPASLSWKDGESAAKTVTLKITAQAAVNPDETFVVTLAKASGSDASLGTVSAYTLNLSDSADPVLDQASYAIPAFKGFAFSRSYAIRNVKDLSKLSVTTGGTLPRGIKFAYDSTTGKIALSGTPTRLGTYAFTVTMSEVRSDKTYTGTAAFSVTVSDATKLSVGDAGYNAVIAAHKAVYATLPVYGATTDGDKALAGTITLSISTALRVRATYTSATGSNLSFSGALSSLDEDGTAKVSLAKGSATLALVIPSSGRATASLTGLNGSLGTTGTTGAEGINLKGDYSGYFGYYLVTLPCDTDGLASAGETVATGTGYVILKMNTALFNSKGQVKYSGMLANGTTFSGTAYLNADQYADDGTTWAVLPIVVKKQSSAVSLPLRIRRGAASDASGNPVAVLAEEDCVPFTVVGGLDCAVKCYGSRYDASASLSDCCTENYDTTEFAMSCATNWFKASTAYGSIAKLPEATVSVGDDDSITVENADSRYAFTLRFAKNTGLVTGRFPMTFGNGKKVTVNYKGVILPGWTSCGGCNDSGVKIPEDRPLFSGAAYFSDRINGVLVKRGFAVEFQQMD